MTAIPLASAAEAYVWALFAAFGLFAVGAVVSIMHGIQELLDPEPATDFVVSYIVLGVALVLEAVSFRQALGQAKVQAARSDTDTLEHVLGTSDPMLRAVFFEDAAAIIGVLVAFVGILLHQVTGSAVPDAVGSILVGILLAVVAVMLIQRNRRFLVGEAVDPRIRSAAMRMLLASPLVTSVSYLHIEYVGPDRVFFLAAVDLAGDAAEHNVAEQLSLLTDRLESNPRITRAVLSLSRPGAEPLAP